MKKFFFFTLLISFQSISQSLLRIEPENFSNVYFFGGIASFNNSEIAVSGYDAMPPNGTLKLYLFNYESSGISPNGILNSPEANQFFGGGIEMTDNYLFVGSTTNNTNITNGGAVYVFKKVNSTWEYLQKIQPATQHENDYFGSNIKIHNGQLFITSFGYDANGDASINEGAVYVFNQNEDAFSFQQIITTTPENTGFGILLDIENDMLVTTSTNSANDFIHVFTVENSNWELVNTTLMPTFNFESSPDIYIPHFFRVSFSNLKLYMYDIVDLEFDLLGQKMIKIYNWSEDFEEWSFAEDFIFQEGDYYEYKVKVSGNNMFIIPVGFYILQMERKNPAFHFVNNEGNWNYNNTYAGMSSYTNDNFGHFTLVKGNKVLFGNANEYWTQPIMAANGGAYMLDVTLGINEFETNNFVIYPNPTDGKISIYAQNSETSSVEIYNSLGKKVLESKSTISEIDISNLTAGIYFCRITSNDNSIIYQKIIKR
ncbi:T9SS type A sorting domain-containing protein [Flavobacterium piscinae]|nr:T9SS type A sorting domain-containing protein [Flavobacterium piscinae]